MVEEALVAVTGAGAVAAIVMLTWSVGLVAGSAWAQSWKVVKRGHFRIVAWCVASLSVLALLASLSATERVEGGPSQRVFVAFFLASALVYLIAQYRAHDDIATIVGWASTAIGVMSLVVTAGLLAQWPIVLSTAGLVCGAALLGSVTNGMLLGHWYLNQPGLKPWALARLTLAGLWVSLLSAVVGLIGASKLVGAPTEGAALGLPGFGDNFGPAFFFIWLALALFTTGVIYMVKRCIDIRSIQSATGLYYVAILTAGVAEFLVRYLMVNAT
ncbi:MAG: hypothetical protein QOG04_1718 [Actinomycetota bacterium]|nr:hypothetical protein [Actinomycetota bacterium]